MGFNQGGFPTIAYVNQASTPLGVDLDALVAASQKFLDEHFVPVWGYPATLVKADPSSVPADAWIMAFLDSADQAGALGYHDLSANGVPISKVFVQDCVKNGLHVSTTSCHELAEMLLDPGCQIWAQNTNTGRLYAYEASDAVEDYEFLIDGVPMSDFVYPSFFEGFHAPGSVKFDHLGKLTRPFQTAPGGYQTVMRAGRISQEFGSKQKQEAFAKEDRRLHRSEYRRPIVSGGLLSWLLS